MTPSGITVDAGAMPVTIQSLTQITLSVAGGLSTITLGPEGVTIQGVLVQINCRGTSRGRARRSSASTQPQAAEVCARFNIKKEALAQLCDGMRPEEFVDALVASRQYRRPALILWPMHYRHAKRFGGVVCVSSTDAATTFRRWTKRRAVQWCSGSCSQAKESHRGVGTCTSGRARLLLPPR